MPVGQQELRLFTCVGRMEERLPRPFDLADYKLFTVIVAVHFLLKTVIIQICLHSQTSSLVTTVSLATARPISLTHQNDQLRRHGRSCSSDHRSAPVAPDSMAPSQS